jgi:hypothetical protein
MPSSGWAKLHWKGKGLPIFKTLTLLAARLWRNKASLTVLGKRTMSDLFMRRARGDVANMRAFSPGAEAPGYTAAPDESGLQAPFMGRCYVARSL